MDVAGGEHEWVIDVVLRANAGEAVDRALELVGRAAAEVTGEELALWDLRVVPRGAVLAREAWAPPSGAMLRRRRSWRRG